MSMIIIGMFSVSMSDATVDLLFDADIENKITQNTHDLPKNTRKQLFGILSTFFSSKRRIKS